MDRPKDHERPSIDVASSAAAAVPEGARHSHSNLIYVLVALTALVLGALAVWISMRLSYSAMDDCGVFVDSGGELTIVVGLFVLAPTVAVVSCVLSLLVARIHPAAGLIVAVVIAALVGYLIVVGTATTIRQQGDIALCPSGIPQGWPWWLTR